MSKIDLLIRELRMELPITVISELEPIFAKYATVKKPRIPGSRAFARTDKHIPKVRKKPRKGRETPAEHDAVKKQLFERANGGCEGARIRRNGEIVREHAPDCPRSVPLYKGDPAHDKSRGSGGQWSLENLRWLSRACHRWEHNGGKPIKVTKREATKGNQ